MGIYFSALRNCVCIDSALCKNPKHKCLCVYLWNCRNFNHNIGSKYISQPGKFKGLTRCYQTKVNLTRSEWCIDSLGKEIKCKADGERIAHECICTTTHHFRCDPPTYIVSNSDCKAKVHDLKKPDYYLE